MKYLLSLSVAAFTLTACATTGSDIDYPAFAVTAAFETPIMASEGDSADDPAIYIAANGTGFIAGTDKQSGLYIYNLDGTQRDYMPIGMINNIDLRDGFSLDGQNYVLMVASDDETNAIVSLLYNATTDQFVTPNGHRLSTGEISPYGICLGRGDDDSFHIGVTTKAGLYAQYEMTEEDGALAINPSRDFSTVKQTEGCVFDDRTGSLYLAVEEGALSHYPMSPRADPVRTEIARINQFGLKADLEGVTLYEDGDIGGYVIVSSQGNNSYGVFSLPDYDFAGRFEIKDGSVDGVSSTDGIAVTSHATPRFPDGFLVVQDDMDDTSPQSDDFKKQNFKVIDWRDIKTQLTR
ncbi:phytase [Fretibacter rubidus]|uniref:phytase n=1 Tax=Fretibacter rubidus TaxID=570162 RepID=UPI00352B57D4